MGKKEGRTQGKEGDGEKKGGEMQKGNDGKRKKEKVRRREGEREKRETQDVWTEGRQQVTRLTEA